MSEDLERRFGIELVRGSAAAVEAMAETTPGREANLAFGKQTAMVREVLGTGDLQGMLSVELLALRNDRAYANDPRERASLDQGILQLRNTQRLVGIVADGERYRREVDQAHQLPKNRRGGLPLDEARQFFGSHTARLGIFERLTRAAGAESASSKPGRRTVRGCGRGRACTSSCNAQR